MQFEEALRKHFKFLSSTAHDNLPALAVSRWNWGPPGDHGRRSLAKMLADMKCRFGVEVGTNHGDSAEFFLKASPKLHLVCVDPYVAYNARHDQKERDACYLDALERLKPYNAQIIRESSTDAVDGFEDRSLDFVNIDGNHEFDYVMQDLIRWAPKVRGGGVIMLHDYCIMWRGGVMAAVDAYTSAHRVTQWYVTKDKAPTAFWERGKALVR
ncbi:MAG TPA: class I SAM-dependent methyltransferase [Pirellulales bacterium]|nr:class I SAM-dependent methyltransferase [Pirellulales bacterium]